MNKWAMAFLVFVLSMIAVNSYRSYFQVVESRTAFEEQAQNIYSVMREAEEDMYTDKMDQEYVQFVLHTAINCVWAGAVYNTLAENSIFSFKPADVSKICLNPLETDNKVF